MSGRYAYSAIAGTGTRVSGVLRGVDRRDVIERLIEVGHHPLDVRAAEGAESRARVSPSELSVFTRQLGTLLRAGLPLVEALRILETQVRHPTLRSVARDLEISLSKESGSIAEAMTAHPRVFDSVSIALVRAGEEGRGVGPAFEELSEHLRRAAKLRGQLIGACAYPIFLLVMGFVAVFALVLFVIPRFEELFSSFGQALPLPTRVLLGVSDFVAAWWVLLLAGFVGACVVVWQSIKRPGPRALLDRALLRSPLVGAVLIRVEVTRFARTFGALLSAGVPAVEALTIVSRGIGNTVVRGMLESVTSAAISGSRLADALADGNVFPPLVINLMRTGEQTGALPSMLSEIAEIYDDEVERVLAGAVKLLEPVLITIIGGVIAGIVAAIMLPIFESSAVVQ